MNRRYNSTISTIKKNNNNNNNIEKWIGEMIKDPIKNYMDVKRSPLSTLFEPETIAIIGATEREGSVGRTVLNNILHANNIENFKIKIYPVNPTRDTCLGIKCYKTLQHINDKIDLVVIVTPANTVISVMKEAAQINVKFAIIITAGFKEAGDEGRILEEKVVEIGRESNMRIIGPNCLGIMNTHHGLNATFASRDTIIKGNIGLISQSGAACTAILDWAYEKKIGFSSFVSIGSMADISWGDLIYYLGSDPNTKNILMYMESVGNDVHTLLSAVHNVSRIKPITIIKCGKSLDAAKAAVSHTGSLVGSYDVFEAALKRSGALIVDTLGELMNCALIQAKQPYPKGKRILVISNAGGPGVVTTDSVCTSGCQMAEISPHIIEKLNTVLPAAWSKSNPIDLLGDASAERYANTLNIIFEEEDKDAYDGIILVLSPQDVTDPTHTAEIVIDIVKKYNKKINKPILASWMGGRTTKEGLRMLNEFGIPTFEYPDEAARIFAMLYKQYAYLERLHEIPEVNYDIRERSDSKQIAYNIIKDAQQNNCKFIVECRAKQILKSYGVDVAEMLECNSVEEAEKNADKLGYPIVAKLNSYTITHKSDYKGVMLNLKNNKQVGEAYKKIHQNVLQYGGKEEDFNGIAIQKMVDAEDGIEFILGTYPDPSFGHIILFGTGGIYVEVYKDKALGLPPLNTTVAKALMEQTKIYQALTQKKGKRFPNVNVEEFAAVLVKFAQMVADLSHVIDECEINPLLVNSKRIVALDARMTIKKNAKLDDTPYTSIRDYPTQYISQHKLKNGDEIRIRPICLSDELQLKDFVENLSDECVLDRYFEHFPVKERIERQNLISVCGADYSNMISLIAENKENNKIYSLFQIQNFFNIKDFGELKITILNHDVHNHGISALLLKNAIHVAKEEGVKTLHSLIRKENKAMEALLRNENFNVKPHPVHHHIFEAFLYFN